ncbi:MAG: aminotransferase class V-fold PLP-dependent enzyme [Candidatus Thorarchaeota archaeon]|nr:MAG: aminotransferase class V-fold PLP-dependent enzyme [Candidatus Thorarchaeota archaeon]
MSRTVETLVMPHGVDREFVAEMFPTLSSMTYLNNASTGIPPKPTIDAIKQYLDNRTKAIGDLDDTLNILKEVRQLLATILGGDYSAYGLAPSTSHGLNSIAHSIDYPEGSNIVLCDLEFPASYIPWQNLCRLRNLELRVVMSEAGQAPLDSFREKIDDRTRVVAVSHVQFGSGYKSDLGALARAVHDVGGYLAADIIQSAGWADLDLVKDEVDFAAGQSAKWLIGPISAGYVYVRREVMDQITPKFLGWWGVEDLTEFGYIERTPLPDARMFQVGSPSVMSYVGLKESLTVINKVPSEIRERVALANADHLRKRLTEIDVPFYDYGEKSNSTIVSCDLEDVESVHKKLVEAAIHCSPRKGRLRISPHWYNTTKEIDRFIEHLG